MKIRITATCELDIAPEHFGGFTEEQLLQYYMNAGDGIEALCSADKVTMKVEKVD